MPLSLAIVTPPTTEPLTLQEARDHLRVDSTESDALIGGYLSAARAKAESYQRRQLMPATLRLSLDHFPMASTTWSNTAGWAASGGWDAGGGSWGGPLDYGMEWWGGIRGRAIVLPRPPVASITSVQYIDDGGVLQTLDASMYQVDTDSEPARLLPAWGQIWPVTRYPQLSAVKITYVAGYASADAVPATTKQGIRLLLGHFYENREAVLAAGARGAAQAIELPLAAKSLLDVDRVEGVW